MKNLCLFKDVKNLQEEKSALLTEVQELRGNLSGTQVNTEQYSIKGIRQWINWYTSLMIIHKIAPSVELNKPTYQK